MEKKEAYQALSDLIYKGFLTVSLKMVGKLFVFKTVNEKEYDLIKIYTGSPDEESYTNRFNLNFLIFSLLSIDGRCILKKRDDEYAAIYDLFSGMPSKLRSTILIELNELRKIYYDSTHFLEGFSYTGQSRRRWRLVGNRFPNCEELTGIPGTNSIGLNVCQESWITLNRMLDEEAKYNQYLSLAILVASASNPKGARGIRARHDASVQKTDERRKKLSQKGTVKKTQWTPEKWAAPVDTAEELVEELLRQMAGKKDRHDLFVDDHMRRIREEADKQAKQTEERLQEIRKKREEEGIGTTLTGTHRILTAKETEELMSRSRNNLVIVESEEVASKAEEKRYFNKIGSKILTRK